ncbi:SAM-dependent methyltransferase [Nocardia nova]|uniref:Methyltransferase n=1 Tax=Nocardia nova TaxID=37330 RepID=A0A2S6A2J0_9NOCA|nr:SAM-dependent methyltransferase [Nocardia nova]PPJ00738.1 methyltransferase [Nocardia nova]PPJ12949.1 methyltransferase [Nocardia nova]PPJ25915.1 methyltransferase [Nocardia nova]
MRYISAIHSRPARSLPVSDHPVDLRTDVAHPARMYDYFLGGKDHYEADRRAAETALANFPAVRLTARTNREFMRTATRYLAEQGVRQFLDIGTGIPTEPNLHQVAQEHACESRVVYVDNDPIVLAHARALLVSAPEGRTTYVQADAADPEAILASRELRDTLDLSQPVAISLMAVVHFVPGDVYAMVNTLMDALAPGSYLAMSHVTTDFDNGANDPDGMGRLLQVYSDQGIPVRPRSRDEVARFFDGLELVEPGVEVIHRWRQEGIEHPADHDKKVSLYGAVGKKV